MLTEDYGCLPSNVPLAIVDTVGLCNHDAKEFLLIEGYMNIVNFAGGIVDWDCDGLHLRVDKTELL